MLKKLTESIALFSVLIVIFGLVKQYLFYLRFDIPINYFLNISELGLIISNDLLVLGLLFGILVFGFYLLTDWEIPIEKINSEVEKRERKLKELQTSNSKRYKKIVNKRKIYILILFIASIIAFIYSNEYGLKLIFATTALLMLPYFFLIFNSTLLYRHLTSNVAQIYLLTVIFVVFYTGFIGNQIAKVEKGKYNGTVIKTADSTYVSDSESYFIGKTEKFLFIYNSRKQSTTIIPTEKIERITLKENYCR